MKPVLLILLSLAFTGLYAQHCRFDNTDIIVLKIHSEKSGKVISNLKVSFIDSLLQPVTTHSACLPYAILYKNYTDTLRFTQNSQEKTKFPEFGLKDYEVNPDKFKFVQDNYMFISTEDFPIASLKIKIEDVDGHLNGGEFETKIIQLTAKEVYDLCSNSAVYYSNKKPDGNEPSNFKTFVPFDVILQTKK